MPIRHLFAITTICLIAAVASAQTRRIRVNLVDQAGAAITTATVRVSSSRGAFIACIPDDGGFSCETAVRGDVSFDIAASGFKPLRIDYKEAEVTCREYVFVMQVAGVEATVVTIGRTGTRLGETPESVAVLDREQIETTAAPTLDDALRQVPGFSIFRRSSSRNANPTTQGVSLRGVGASGASRSIVMFDGVPLNDPFGGWVQWNRVSPAAVETVEVLRGGASSLYGNSSLSGAIGIAPRNVSDELAVSAEVFGGGQRAIFGSAFAGGKFGRWFGDVSGGHFQTRGFIPVPEEERGPVDSFAGVRTSNVTARFGREIARGATIFIRPSYFVESRTNGTPAQINRTHSRHVVLGGRIGCLFNCSQPNLKPPGSDFEWRIYGGTQVYDQTFSAVAADRSAESLTRLQRSPSQNFGFSGIFSSSLKRHAIVAGIEGREVRGSSDEVGFTGGRATSLLGAGGRERTVGLFARDNVRLGDRVIVSGGLRYDRWKNFGAASVTTSHVSGIATVMAFPDRDEDSWSPSASVLVQATGGLSLHAAASRSFRAPTLNELYRGFRVGNVVTNPNENLLAERASNFEAGAAFRNGIGGVRVWAFLTDIDRTISNVTIASTSTLITRQRQNAGKTRTAGIEIDAEMRAGAIDLNLRYLLADSRVTEFRSNPDLVDKFIPQVPRHQFTFQVRYAAKSWTFAGQGRASSDQFDDDLNLFRLEPYFQLDAFASRRMKKKVELFAAVENVFNSRYSVGRTPLRTVSSPVNARVGLRWR